MADDRLRVAINWVQEATAKDNRGEYESALECYKIALSHWQLICKYQQNPLLKEKLYRKMEPYMARAEAIKEFLDTQRKQITQSNTASSADQRCVSTNSSGSGEPDEADSTAAATSTSSSKLSQEDEKLKATIADVIIIDKPNVKWHDIAGLDAAKESLQEAIILPTKFPELFVGCRKPWKGILLYGPPGTGKTHLGRACATEAASTFLAVSSADLLSKWLGESEKLVRMLFLEARQRSPSIIFVDEIDALCGSRNDRESESARRIKTEFLIQMGGLSNSNDDSSQSHVLVLGTTNVPWSLDAAIRRRFERRIYIPLPDTQARLQMFRIHIGDTPHNLSDNDFNILANYTEGFSGADIAVIVRSALFEPIRRCRVATHFKQVNKDGSPFVEDINRLQDEDSGKRKVYWSPCSPHDSDPTKQERMLMSIPAASLVPPELMMADFESVLEASKPSVGREDILMYDRWTEKFGMEGN